MSPKWRGKSIKPEALSPVELEAFRRATEQRGPESGNGTDGTITVDLFATARALLRHIAYLEARVSSEARREP